MQRTGIEYLTHTSNPIVMRCTRVSAGCLNCWHLRTCERGKNNPLHRPERRAVYAGLSAPIWDLREAYELHTRSRPAVVGVQLMGDWCHESLLDETMQSLLGHLPAAPGVTSVLLTKRPARMIKALHENMAVSISKSVWFGVSAEDQANYNVRVKTIPKWLRYWLSAEPLLGPIVLREPFPAFVAAGPETGPGARECKPEWLHFLADQCTVLDIPFFDKSDVPVRRETPWEMGKKVSGVGCQENARLDRQEEAR